jgi:hypothetical protein
MAQDSARQKALKELPPAVQESFKLLPECLWSRMNPSEATYGPTLDNASILRAATVVPPTKDAVTEFIETHFFRARAIAYGEGGTSNVNDARALDLATHLYMLDNGIITGSPNYE